MNYLPYTGKNINKRAEERFAFIRTKMYKRAEESSASGEKVKEVTVIDADAYEQSSTVADTWWLKELDLCQSDKELITSNKWLSAPIITAAQMILSKQFEDVIKAAGFQDVGYSLTMSFEIERHRFIQVLHEPQGHWLTVSNVGTEHPEIVRVYDSLYSSAVPAYNSR